jgi:hypothetical protein
MGDEKGPVNGMADVEKDNIGAEPSVAGGVKPWLEYEEEWKAETEKAKKYMVETHRPKLRDFWSKVVDLYIETTPDIIGYLEKKFGPLGHINYGPPAFSLRIFHPGSRVVSITYSDDVQLYFQHGTFVFFTKALVLEYIDVASQSGKILILDYWDVYFSLGEP